jgi:hypothetical protein
MSRRQSTLPRRPSKLGYWRALLGVAVATFRGIRGARRHLIYLQHDLGQAVRRGGWNGKATLTPSALDTLAWWASDAPWQRNPPHPD